MSAHARARRSRPGDRVGPGEPHGRAGLVVNVQVSGRIRVGPIGPDGRFVWITLVRGGEGSCRVGILADRDVLVQRAERLTPLEHMAGGGGEGSDDL